MNADEKQNDPEPPRPKTKTKKKHTTRTIGTNNYGADDYDGRFDRRSVKYYSKNTADTYKIQSVSIFPIILLGVRLDPRQALEYFHILDPKKVPKPDFPITEEAENIRLRPWEYSWRGIRDMDRVYGTTIPDTDTLMSYFLRLLHCYGITMIIDKSKYVYIGYTPQPNISQDGYCGYIQYTYINMHKLDVRQMEDLQRIIYRIPLHDNLNAAETKLLHELRMGGLTKYPHYYLVNAPEAIAGYPHVTPSG